jgi:hypothetical protein
LHYRFLEPNPTHPKGTLEMADAKEYQAKARELREKARTTHAESGRLHRLVMADQYDWLAALAEGREPEPKNR